MNTKYRVILKVVPYYSLGSQADQLNTRNKQRQQKLRKKRNVYAAGHYLFFVVVFLIVFLPGEVERAREAWHPRLPYYAVLADF